MSLVERIDLAPIEVGLLQNGNRLLLHAAALAYECPAGSTQWLSPPLVAIVCIVEQCEGWKCLNVYDARDFSLTFSQEFYVGFDVQLYSDKFLTCELEDKVLGLAFASSSDTMAIVGAVQVISSSIAPNAAKKNSASGSSKKEKLEDSLQKGKTFLGKWGKKIYKGAKKMVKKNDSGKDQKRNSVPQEKEIVISGPIQGTFEHKSHIGFDPNKGFRVKEVPPEWMELFHSAGISDEQLEDKQTAAFIFDSIQEYVAQQGDQAFGSVSERSHYSRVSSLVDLDDDDIQSTLIKEKEREMTKEKSGNQSGEADDGRIRLIHTQEDTPRVERERHPSLPPPELGTTPPPPPPPPPAAPAAPAIAVSAPPPAPPPPQPSQSTGVLSSAINKLAVTDLPGTPSAPSTPQLQSPLASTEGSAMLASIRSFNKSSLKKSSGRKVSDKALDLKKMSNSGKQGLADFIRSAMDTRREKSHFDRNDSDEDDDDDDDDDDEWD